jgi:hypothetical protein
MPMFIKLTKITFLPVLIVTMILLISCRNNYDQFSSVTQKFQDSVNGELTLCFYPSTIRTLNFNNDSTFNNIFSDIKKIKVVRFNRSSDTTKIIDASEWAEKIREDKYVDLLRFKQNNRDIMIFLLKHNAWGYLLGSVFTMKTITMGLGVSAMGINMARRGVPDSLGILIPFLTITAVNLVLAVLLMRSIEEHPSAVAQKD